MRKEHIFTNVAVNLIIVAVLLTVVLAGVVVPAGFAGGKEDAIYRGNAAEPRVTLMFNVYWGTEYIPAILEMLEKYNVKTTFFVGGSWVAKNRECFLSIVEAGHEIGSHGYLHKDAEKLDYKANLDELALTEKQIESVCGAKLKLFAPPSGSIGTEMFKACDELGYTVIMWSKDTIDWRDKNPDLVTKRATTGIQNGDLVLMHPTAHTLEALPKVLDFYAQNGFRAVTVSENISPSNS